MGLITAFEVRKYSIAEREYSMEKVQHSMEAIEADFIRNYLGQDTFDLLTADVISWATIKEWKSTTTYSINNKVFWLGAVWNSKVNLNTQEPGLEASNWEEAKKFNTSEYDNLWKKYLAKLVGNKIVKDTAILNTYKAAGKGLSVSTEDQSNTNALSEKEMHTWHKQISNLIDIIQRECTVYIQSQYDKFLANPATGFDYSKVSWIQGTGENINQGNKVGRRFGMKY